MRIALARFDATVGDVEGNVAGIVRDAARLARGGARCVAFPELAACGYPPRDLLQRAGFVEHCEERVARAAAELAGLGAGEAAVLVGLPVRAAGTGPALRNAVAVLRGGRIEAIYAKRLLPDYDVFDEPRHFAPGGSPLVIQCGGRRVGILACEDLWRGEDAGPAARRYGVDPAAEAVAAGADVLVCASASPFAAGKHAEHVRILHAAARRCGRPVCSVNALGANDDLVFDGDARIAWPDGGAVAAARWHDDALVHDLQSPGPAAQPGAEALAVAEAERWHAIVTGIRGYFRKTGHRHALLGLSGGIDSALVAALAAAALGPSCVQGILMPSRHSSEGSRADAHELARRTGIAAVEVPVEPLHEAVRAHLGPRLASAGASLEGLPDENLQSRLRGVQLMALSNATGALVLATGNKSELAVGYSTLYGDMCGALAPIGDVLKCDVWALARWANAHHRELGFASPPVPQGSIDKPPSAELRPDQVDQDSLPPYRDLDAIVRGWVEDEDSVDSIAVRTGLDRALVARWTRAIDMAQYKRAQAPVVLRLSRRAFGPGRRMPVVARDAR